MYNIYRVVWIWFVLFASVMAGESIIILDYGDYDSMVKEQASYEAYANVHHLSVLHPKIENKKEHFLLQVGPFVRDENLALTYMRVKEKFPNAVIIEKSTPVTVSKESANSQETIVYRDVPVEKEDDSLWIALFGLALVGVLFMYLSSDKIKRLKAEQEKIKLKHKKLEEKQHEVLSKMGENIHHIAKETMSNTSMIAEKIKETPLYAEMEKVMYNENELLDVTEDLIKFLRLKSKKVVIQHEIFNFNHVLNEVAGLLNQIYHQNDMELIFNIDKDVPRYMLSDSLHMGQILTNLLEYMMQHTQNNEICLNVTTESHLKERKYVYFKLMTHLHIEDIKTLFDSYYDEASRRYVGLGLFLAKELTHLMNGELEVDKNDEGYNYFILKLPIEEKNKEKRKYRLPDKGLVGKKILIVDTNYNAAQATEKLFAYFRAEVTVLSLEYFKKHMPNFANYEIVALSPMLFNVKTVEVLQRIKKSQNLKVIRLDNLFASKTATSNEVVDIVLVKPLTQEYVFDTMIELYENKNEKREHQNQESIDQNRDKVLPIHRDAFPEMSNINLDSFTKFSGAHILIVEDNLINQKVVLSVLGKSGMTLSVVNNGKEAVTFMHTHAGEVDFIFMDINMPVMDGYSATRCIREDNRHATVAIVALTALVSEHEIDKMFDAGMNGYLSKPVHIERLYAALDMFLSPAKQEGTSVVSSETITPIKLDGLNVSEGLEHMKNNDIFYKEVLKEFLDAYAQSDVVFENLVKEQRYMQIKMLCWDMKGLTSTIGAKEMHIVINEIYQLILYKKPELLHSYISRYKTEFTKLHTAIQTYLES
jgi:CheY-like chemotaxis protein/signal transduction histidine kinase